LVLYVFYMFEVMLSCNVCFFFNLLKSLKWKFLKTFDLYFLNTFEVVLHLYIFINSLFTLCILWKVSYIIIHHILINVFECFLYWLV
jgi:hypothetical protein